MESKLMAQYCHSSNVQPTINIEEFDRILDQEIQQLAKSTLEQGQDISNVRMNVTLMKLLKKARLEKTI